MSCICINLKWHYDPRSIKRMVADHLLKSVIAVAQCSKCRLVHVKWKK